MWHQFMNIFWVSILSILDKLSNLTNASVIICEFSRHKFTKIMQSCTPISLDKVV